MADHSCGKSKRATMSSKKIGILFFLVVILCLVPHTRSRNVPKKDNEEEKYILAKDENCAHDVKNLCPKVKKDNNFAIFLCLQEAALKDEDDVSDECHGTLWHYKYNLTRNPQFDEVAFKVCESTLEELKDVCKDTHHTPGFLMNCLIEHRHNVQDQKCSSFLTRMSSIVFSDYRLIKGFYENCHKDVKTLNCGQLAATTEDDPHHEQAEVVSCLEASIDSVSDKCQHQLLRIAELQADDFHLDRPLFYACQEARERYCPDVKAGEGRIYKCLLNHVTDEMMPAECSTKLEAREKMMQKDVKVNYPLWKECQGDFEKYQCEKNGASQIGQGSNLLLCLQGKVSEGKPVSPNCQAEMRNFATMVFDNYQISPIIVAHCDVEIHNFCSNLIGKRDDGDMMDCLMTQATTNVSLGAKCFEAIGEVLKETNAGNNYKVDRALYVACEPVISSLCQGKEDAMILGCLMDHAHNPKMPEVCATQVFHLQYFLSRDFRLDASLYQDCKQDAEEICKANNFDAKTETNSPDNFVIACLYRNSFAVEPKVSKDCSAHIHRIMASRADTVKLVPQIQSACMRELGSTCLDKTGKNEEIDCLQNNYENLSDKCKKAIQEFTEMESKDFDLDKHLVDKCASMVTKFCQRELEEGDGEKVLPCLVQHKNDVNMDHQCASAVEHWQLLEMKDYNFSPALKDMCMKDISIHCKNERTKFDAVKCLSQKIVTDFKSVSEHCRAQVKNELMVQSENLRLNPELFTACEIDIRKLCLHVEPTAGKLEECLRENHHKLSNPKCKRLLYEQEKVEAKDPELDYRLVHVCANMVKRYCSGISQMSDIMSCLRQFTHDQDMSRECKEIVLERQIEQAESFELDHELVENCEADAKKYCHKEMKNAKRGVDDGAVFGCLVQALMNKKKLKSDCEQFVRRREEEAAMEVNLNPLFLKSCREEVDRLCGGLSHDDVIDCMKLNLPQIRSKECVGEVRKLIVEGIEDVHVDPHLQEQCARDIRTFCSDMPRKSGNVVLCLIDVHKAKNLHLKPGCENFLSKRMQLYNAAEVDLAGFDSISAVIQAVHQSPNRNNIYMTLMVILTILFVGGIIFGRFTKRVRAEVKNR
ncbi:Golgi apparatus protein 1-like isoform X2 [Hydractinia symbiolongicarpus]|uniref:Golgi apparatus protein 1-like isoform X2 n=1 Tax=Hydractinia symbiolongicarpus TaxID=13093 RepID=UPI00254B5A0C|nr:Golgi apparatus protein 1-like isoform X2 [Hydractinia symbiolongicarpus]